MKAKIIEKQKKWAERRNFQTAKKEGPYKFYLKELNDNFYKDLDASIQKPFIEGKGREIIVGEISKMNALFSSSAAFINFCRPLIDYGLASHYFSITEAFEFNFEQEAPVFSSARSHPTLDGLFETNDDVIAIESKFTEIFDMKYPKIQDTYFNSKPIWEGLESLFDLASQIKEERIQFMRLDVSQLIKHCLGLKQSFKDKKVTLVYFYYDYIDFTQHESEIKLFKSYIEKDDINFKVIKYSELLHYYQDANVDENITKYLEERYF